MPPAPGGSAMLPPSGGGGGEAHSSSGELSLDGEEQQGCFDLYRRAYGRHLDVAYPPAYLACASLALWSDILPFWLAALLLPAGMVLLVHLLLVKGECCRLSVGGCCGGREPFDRSTVGCCFAGDRPSKRTCCRRLACAPPRPRAPTAPRRRRHPRGAAAALAPAGGDGGQP